jgi:hypothetical protein
MDKSRSSDLMDLPLPFFSRNRGLYNTDLFKRFTEALNILKSCSYLVRSIAGVVESEKKPLFGAFNTRQVNHIFDQFIVNNLF